MKQNKVTANFAQNYDTTEKAQARQNIGAASDSVATHSNPGLMSVADKVKLDSIESGAQANVQANWAQTDVDAPSYIQNKPENLVQDANYVHTDNNFTTTLKDKLDGIEDGAEVNVQSNWAESDNTADSFILNKPGIPAQLTIMRKATDTTNANRYAKIAELVPSTQSYYVDNYDFEFTTSGSTGADGHANDAGVCSISLVCRQDTNVYYVNGQWLAYNHYDYTSDPYRCVTSVLVLKQLETGAGGQLYCRKIEVWLKLSTSFSDHDVVSVSYLLNTGVHQYRTTYPSKTSNYYPWTVTTGTIWATTTAPTMDSTAPMSYETYEFWADDTKAVQSNWNQSDSTKLDYIQNKPLVPELHTKYTENGSLTYNRLEQMTLGLDKSEIYGVKEGDTANTMFGLYGPYPESADNGKYLKAVYGAGNACYAVWDTPPNTTYSAGTNLTLSGTTFNCTNVMKHDSPHVTNQAFANDTDFEYSIFGGDMTLKLHFTAYANNQVNSVMTPYLKGTYTNNAGWMAFVNTHEIDLNNNVSDAEAVVAGDNTYVSFDNGSAGVLYGPGAWFSNAKTPAMMTMEVQYMTSNNTASMGRIIIMRAKSFVHVMSYYGA